MPDTLRQFAEKMDKAAKLLEKSSKEAVAEAGKILEAGATKSMLAATGGTGHLRNVKGSALRVKTTIKQTGTTSASATVAAVGGPYAILDNPTKGHWIGQGKSTNKLRKGLVGPARPGKNAGTGKPIRIGNNWVEGPVHHPGTHGKHTFSAGTEAVSEEAVKAMSKVHVSAFESAFKL